MNSNTLIILYFNKLNLMGIIGNRTRCRYRKSRLKFLAVLQNVWDAENQTRVSHVQSECPTLAPKLIICTFVNDWGMISLGMILPGMVLELQSLWVNFVGREMPYLFTPAAR